MLLVIDNYDSYTQNLVHIIESLDIKFKLIRNDEISVEELYSLNFTRLLISPGPSIPKNSKLSIEALKIAIKEKIPTLGVCLGHQLIGEFFGCKLYKLPHPVHGKIFKINTLNSIIYHNLPESIEVTRYHSWAVDQSSDLLKYTAFSSDNIIMSLEHINLPIYGIQYHPESIATIYGKNIIENFFTFT